MTKGLTSWNGTMTLAPPGYRAIAGIRISGDKPFNIVNELFPAKDLLKEPSNTLHVVFLQDDKKFRGGGALII